jgi:hypothetical protein
VAIRVIDKTQVDFCSPDFDASRDRVGVKDLQFGLKGYWIRDVVGYLSVEEFLRSHGKFEKHKMIECAVKGFLVSHSMFFFTQYSNESYWITHSISISEKIVNQCFSILMLPRT